METPKKPVKKKTASKTTGAKKPAEKPVDAKPKKRFVDDDEDEDEFDMPIDDLGRYDSFDGYEEEEDF